MKVTKMWSANQGPTISFELLPPRSSKGAESLEKTIKVLAGLSPDFVSVTFGAGGSTRDGSRQLVETLRNEMGLEVMAYFAGYGLGPEEIAAVLDDYEALGVENLLVVRGDPPHKPEGFEPHPDSLPYASDLVTFIRPRYGFCIGVAGYPEGHIECESEEKDIEYLKLKVDNGAEYVVSNYFYDNQYFFDFVERCRAAGIDVPIIPGVMPIYSVRMLEKLASLCGATIVKDVREGIAALPDGDTEALAAFGIEYAVGQCRELIEAGVPGLHIYTMDRSRAPAGILNRLRSEALL